MGVLPVNRRRRIVEIVEETGSLTCEDACLTLNVSLATIRQDFKFLEDQGKLKRVYGGVVALDNANEDTVEVGMREITNSSVKDALGKAASRLVKDGDIIFLDGSSSSIYIAKHIKDKQQKVTVITNAQRVVMELNAAENVELICVGGFLRKKNLSFVGKVTEDIIRTAYRANKVFISCTGLSFINGITDGSERETDVKIAMIDVSEEVILVCDQSKFGKISFPKIADISRINCFITDADESNSLIKKIKKAYPAIKIYSIFGKADI